MSTSSFQLDQFHPGTTERGNIRIFAYRTVIFPPRVLCGATTLRGTPCRRSLDDHGICPVHGFKPSILTKEEASTQCPSPLCTLPDSWCKNRSHRAFGLDYAIALPAAESLPELVEAAAVSVSSSAEEAIPPKNSTFTPARACRRDPRVIPVKVRDPLPSPGPSSSADPGDDLALPCPPLPWLTSSRSLTDYLFGASSDDESEASSPPPAKRVKLE